MNRKISEGKAGRYVKTRWRVAVNFNFLDEFERALVLFQLRILKIKRERGYRFDEEFLFLFDPQKEIHTFCMAGKESEN